MDLGSWAEWVGAVATAGGFGAAVWQLRHNARVARVARDRDLQDEEARRLARAYAVGIKAMWKTSRRGGARWWARGLVPVKVEVYNSGEYPLTDAVLMIATDNEYPMEVVYGAILPGERLKDTYKVKRTEIVFGELTAGVSLVFTDVYGNHWERSTFDLQRRDQAARVC